MTPEDANNSRMSIYYMVHCDMSLLDLKQWVDQQITNGQTHVSVDVEYYEDQIDGLTLESKKKP